MQHEVPQFVCYRPSLSICWGILEDRYEWQVLSATNPCGERIDWISSDGEGQDHDPRSFNGPNEMVDRTIGRKHTFEPAGDLRARLLRSGAGAA